RGVRAGTLIISELLVGERRVRRRSLFFMKSGQVCWEEEGSGRQDKGCCSHQLLGSCLHIEFLRDTQGTSRDFWSLASFLAVETPSHLSGSPNNYHIRARRCWIRALIWRR